MNTETEKQELQNKRNALVLSKREHETKLIAIKNVVRSGGRMPNEKYKQCCDAQNTHTRAILHIEKELTAIKTRVIELSNSEFQSKARTQTDHKEGAHDAQKPVKSIIAELVALRQEYQNFSADGTRVSSMRQMASGFVLQLNPIIKRAIGVN